MGSYAPPPGCNRDDPYMLYYLLGGNPWHGQDGELRRIYFDPSPGLRGQQAWECDNPGRAFPAGYYDVQSESWVCKQSGWTSEDYSHLMRAAVKRKTVAQSAPSPKVFTRDGVEMADGMIVMFVDGQIPGKPHWGTQRLQNKLMIAGKRLGSWHYGDAGKIVRYGPMNIPVREYADHAHPRSWLVYPLRDGERFEIEGGNFVVEWSFLFVDPTLSLISVDGGKRFADAVPDTPSAASINDLVTA